MKTIRPLPSTSGHLTLKKNKADQRQQLIILSTAEQIKITYEQTSHVSKYHSVPISFSCRSKTSNSWSFFQSQNKLKLQMNRAVISLSFSPSPFHFPPVVTPAFLTHPPLHASGWKQGWLPAPII